uniref:Sine oculis-binding protein homolog n=1 Tax=Rhodnius prolixus TaxID=13249 RepID=T1HAE0_RHOPR
MSTFGFNFRYSRIYLHNFILVDTFLCKIINNVCLVPAGCMCCAWCQKVSNAKQFNFKTPSGKTVFCSEQCFTQCRRANFKRNKTCDWCRHVRHTVNYVDFQDGDHQLQFCSDKCLNQYKMNIFCKETQAHLELHPHLREGANSGQGSSDSGGGNANLITPELWMRDCRSQSPDTDRSATPPRIPSPLVEIKTSPRRNQVVTDKKSSREGIKKKMMKIRKTVKADHSLPLANDQRNSSLSPRSNGSASPPKAHLQAPPMGQPPVPLPPPPHHHFLPDRPPIFIPPGFIPSPHIFHDIRFNGTQRLPQRTSQAHVPPLLPINRPLQPPIYPFIPTSPLIPPPTTIVPYPVFLPIPLPIPIPIPLPGVKFSDLANSKPENLSPSPPSHASLETNDNINNNNVLSNVNNNNNVVNNNNSINNNSDINSNTNTRETTPEAIPATKYVQAPPPPRKRKRLTEISQESEPIRNAKSVHA